MEKHTAIPLRGVTPVSDSNEGELLRISPVASVISDHESETALDSVTEKSHLTESTKSSASTGSDTRHSVVSSFIASTIIEPVSNVVITPTSAPRIGNLWAALRSGRVRTLLYSSLVAVMASLSFGYAMGYSSPALIDLDNYEGKHRFFNKTIYHDAFNAIAASGGLLGGPLAGWLVDYSGRHFTLVMCSVPFTLGWFLILITAEITGPLYRPVLLLGRFISGVGIGSASLVVPLYIAEISPSNLRGLFGSMNQLAVTAGILLVQSLGIRLSYLWLTTVAILVMVIFVPLAAWTLKESPRWLISHGENASANRVLNWLRGPTYDIDEEQREIETQIASEGKFTFLQSLPIIATWPVLHPLILSMFLMFFQDFSGVNAIIFNGEEIFIQAGVKNASVVTAVAIGLVQFIGTLIGAFLTDIFGRKLLLMVGGVVMCIGMLALSAYDFLKNEPYCDPGANDSKCITNLDALAIGAMVFYVAGFSIGWGALPWLLTSELIPTRVRGAGVGIATCFSWLTSVIVLAAFGSYEEAVKQWGLFLSFGIIALISVFFVGFFIPETKGKSLEEIERYFNRHRNQYTPL